MLMQNTDYLLNAAEPWVVYRTMLDLMSLKENNPKVQKSREQLLKHPLMQGLVEELQDWPGTVLSSHKSVGQHYHKLAFRADMDLTTDDDRISQIIQKVKEHRSEEGLFQLSTNVPVHFGGSGQYQEAWALCDAPLVMYSVVKMDKKNTTETHKGVDFLLNLKRENGYQ